MLSVQNCSVLAKLEAQEKIEAVELIFFPGCPQSSTWSLENFFLRLGLPKWTIDSIAEYFAMLVGSTLSSETTNTPSCNEYNISIPLNDSSFLLQEEQFSKDKCMVLYIFGFTSDANGEQAQNIIDAYLQQGIYNVLLLDYSDITQNNLYTISVSLSSYLAPVVAQVLDDLIDGGVELCHLAGHSLGAQTASDISRSMRNRVPHIIGLEPAGPLYYPPINCSEALNENDADCVEVVHTDGGGLGAPLSFTSGRNEFYVNGGTRTQPGCDDYRLPTLSSLNPETGCSHNRVTSIYAEALRNPERLIGINCSSWDDFKSGTCEGNALMTIGSCSNSIPPGTYYLRTNDKAPFGKGAEGIEPASDDNSR
ncbi:phospholipase A1 VesT1.02 [Anabrus simplex]|uniref:phospholipase A1 VesT1.02 n=1 Tax=Anabrus simplex TaxID=316456 RepID=UPI0035A28344